MYVQIAAAVDKAKSARGTGEARRAAADLIPLHIAQKSAVNGESGDPGASLEESNLLKEP